MIGVLADAAESAATALEVFGLPALFAIFLLKGALIGKPFPTSVFLPGYVIATGAALREATVILVVVTVAHILGQLLVFGGCRRYGSSFVDRIPLVNLDPESDRFRRFDRWFGQHGGASIFLTNVLPWTRGLIAIPAGVGSYPVGRYTFHVTTATLLYHGIYVAVALGLLAILR